MKPWFIWVDRPPGYQGYLPKREHWNVPVTQQQFNAAVYSTSDPEKAEGFDTEADAQQFISKEVHPYLKPHCTPTTVR